MATGIVVRRKIISVGGYIGWSTKGRKGAMEIYQATIKFYQVGGKGQEILYCSDMVVSEGNGNTVFL